MLCTRARKRTLYFLNLQKCLKVHGKVPHLPSKIATKTIHSTSVVETTTSVKPTTILLPLKFIYHLHRRHTGPHVGGACREERLHLLRRSPRVHALRHPEAYR